MIMGVPYDAEIAYLELNGVRVDIPSGMIPVRVGSGTNAVGYIYDRATRKLIGATDGSTFVLGPDVAKPVMGLRKFKPTARNYVQDGLVAMWDGIENAGWGVHDPNVQYWRNLVVDSPYGDAVRGSPATKSYEWRDNALFVYGDQYSAAFVSSAEFNPFDLFGQQQTVEGVCQGVDYAQNINWCAPCLAMYGPIFGISSATRTSIHAIVPENAFSQTYLNGDFFIDIRNTYTNVQYYSLLWTCGDRTSISGKINGQSFSVPSNWRWSQTSTARRVLSIGFCAANCSMLIKSIRMYSRALTADEIAANYAIDKIRFNLP